MKKAQQLAQKVEAMIKSREEAKEKQTLQGQKLRAEHLLAKAPHIIENGMRLAEEAAAEGKRMVVIHDLTEATGDEEIIDANLIKKRDEFEGVSEGLALICQAFRNEGFRVNALANVYSDDCVSEFSHYSIQIVW